MVALLCITHFFSRAIGGGGWFRWEEAPDRSDQVVPEFVNQAAVMLQDLVATELGSEPRALDACLGDARESSLQFIRHSHLLSRNGRVPGLAGEPAWPRRHHRSTGRPPGVGQVQLCQEQVGATATSLLHRPHTSSTSCSVLFTFYSLDSKSGLNTMVAGFHIMGGNRGCRWILKMDAGLRVVLASNVQPIRNSMCNLFLIPDAMLAL